MVKPIDETHEQRIRDFADRASPVKEAWEQTNDEMHTLADELREDGWEVAAITTVHTGLVTPEFAETEDGFGLVHVVPDNHADAFREAFEPGQFESFEVYQREVAQSNFQVTALYDEERRVAILLAVYYDYQRAQEFFNAVIERDVLYTHCKTLDGTRLGSFRHDDYEPMIPQRFRP